MIPRGGHPASADERGFNPHNIPLLSQENHQHQNHDQVDDELERADGDVTEGFSRQGSLEFTDRPFARPPSQPRTWTAIVDRYARWFSSSRGGWKRRPEDARINRSGSLRVGLYLIAIILMILGIVQFISLTFLTYAALFPDFAASIVDRWGDASKLSRGLLHWPTDFSRDVIPVPCHSHNDYWREFPLYGALQAGCIGVEADVWLVEDDLHVGHSTSSLTSNRTLRKLYINPLLDILAKQNPTTEFHPDRDSPPNGVFDTDPAQTLILLIDFKTEPHALWPYVHAQLDPLRAAGFLTTFDGTSVVEGPVTVVATGNAPFDLVTANSTYRDIFFDAPLDRLGAGRSSTDQHSGPDASSNGPIDASSYNITNSYYASTSFEAAIGVIWSGPSAQQLELIRSQIRGAHHQGLKVRYWETPFWPRSRRNHIWNVLVEEGVDILNVDDLKAATQGTWGNWG